MLADRIPRYAEPRWDELPNTDGSPTCADCCYCKPVDKLHVCVYEPFQADTFDGLADALVAFVEPTDDACSDWKER